MMRKIRWVACSTREFGEVGRERHLLVGKSLTTMCGHSASVPGIWAGNHKKAKCKRCNEIEEEMNAR